MSLAKILAVLDGAPGSEAALQAAIELGRGFSARVELLHVEVDAQAQVPLAVEGMSGTAVQQVMDSLRAEAERLRAEAHRLFETHCVQAGLPVVEPDAPAQPGSFAVALRHVTGREPQEVRRRGRLADLIVIAREAERGEPSTPSLDTALFDTGRPVLLVPAGPAPVLGGTAAVAWNGTREAARAVGAALPLLDKAERVVVLSGREGTEGGAASSELVGYLAAHEIAARTWAFTPDGGPIGQALLSEAAKAEARLLVMGAYGHSRLRELVLGGATRGVLAAAAIPVLMMH